MPAESSPPRASSATLRSLFLPVSMLPSCVLLPEKIVSSDTSAAYGRLTAYSSVISTLLQAHQVKVSHSRRDRSRTLPPCHVPHHLECHGHLQATLPASRALSANALQKDLPSSQRLWLGAIPGASFLDKVEDKVRPRAQVLRGPAEPLLKLQRWRLLRSS